MSRLKLTKSLKSSITAEWHKHFPSLGIYKPMWLMNRLGPLIVGLLLEVTGGAEYYCPTFHVHSLLRPFSIISLQLKIRTRDVAVYPGRDHSKVVDELSTTIREIAVIPYEGVISLNEVLNAYRNYFARPNRIEKSGEYADLALLSAWCGNSLEAHRCLKYAEEALAKWPEYALARLGGLDAWIEGLRTKAADVERLRSTVSEEIEKLKLGKLPTRELLC